MGFKKIDPYFTFADLALKDSMDKSRCLTRLMDIADSIDWDQIESVLMHHYQVGGSKEGAEAYPPILLFKCMLLQKWFHIDSDPRPLHNYNVTESKFQTCLQMPPLQVFSATTHPQTEALIFEKQAHLKQTR